MNKTAKTSAQRQQALRQRRAAFGLTRHEHYYNKEDHTTVVEVVKGLNDKRLNNNKDQQT